MFAGWNYRLYAGDLGLTEADPEAPLGALILVEAHYDEHGQIMGILEANLIFDDLKSVDEQLEWVAQAKGRPVIVAASKHYPGTDYGVPVEVVADKALQF